MKGDKLNPSVRKNLQLTREVFPDAEIILSTWEMSPLEEDELQLALVDLNIRTVFSPDPGMLARSDRTGSYRTNVNRILRSAQAGLAIATRPLAIKLRTDTRLTGRKIVHLLGHFVLCGEGPARDPAYQVFRARVINASWFARDERGSMPYLFHPGDILLAGLTEDVRLFFSAPMASYDLFVPVSTSGNGYNFLYVSEQWLWVNAIWKATGNKVFSGNIRYSKEDVANSEQYFLANFVPFSAQQLQLCWPKYWSHYPLRGLFSVMTYRRWHYRCTAYLQGHPERPYSLVTRTFITIWRCGYRLRERLLHLPTLRRIAVRLFVHR